MHVQQHTNFGDFPWCWRRSRLFQRSGAHAGHIEALEPRLALSASLWSLQDRVLTVTGTDYADNISVGRTGRQLMVRVNSARRTFSTTAVGRLVVRAGGGDDMVIISSTVRIGAEIYGGAGKDVIRAQNHDTADCIDGGPGRDTAYIDAAYVVPPGAYGFALFFGRYRYDSTTSVEQTYYKDYLAHG